MQQYIQESQEQNNYQTYKKKNIRQPNEYNKYNEEYLYNGPSGLKRDQDGLYKALEYETIKNLEQMERNHERSIKQLEYSKDESLRFQQSIDQAQVDNQALYIRCKELEAYLFETNPLFRGQYFSIIQENEELRNQNRALIDKYGGQAMGGFSRGAYNQSIGTSASNKMQILQSEIEKLKIQNNDLKVRIRLQLEEQRIPYSRSLITSPNKYSSSFYASPTKPIQPQENYCGSIIQSNEQHNRAVLDRCRSIVAAHNYY